MDTSYVERLCQAVEQNDGDVIFVQLICDRNELERRAQLPDRAEMDKLTLLDGLRELYERYDWNARIRGRESLRVDNTDLAPDEVARRIVAHFQLPMS